MIKAFFALARLAMYLCLMGWIGTYFMTQRLPPHALIDKALYSEPIQTMIPQKPFNVMYKDNPFAVIAVADYEIWGLVVSHNDPGVCYSFDVTHDPQSLDTRDLCVLWGSNLQNDNYRTIHFFNSDYGCHVEWGAHTDTTRFSADKFSNNHLIADSDAIRATIASVNIGDQIYIKGKLVNYADTRWTNGFWRKTSLSRNDTGMGACEIIFVEEIKTLHSYNTMWAGLHRLFREGFLGLLLLGFASWFLPRRKIG